MQPLEGVDAIANWERRRALLMSRQQNIGSIWAMTPATLCSLLFSCLLFAQLNGNLSTKWWAVFSPLWVADLYMLVLKAGELTAYVKTVIDNGDFIIDYYTVLKLACTLVDTLGMIITKVFLVSYLQHQTQVPLENAIIPAWTALFLTTFLRLCMCVGTRWRMVVWRCVRNYCLLSFNIKHVPPVVMNGIYTFVFYGVQPTLIVLKVNGHIHTKWAVVFIPTWLVICFAFLAATVLLHCAPVVRASSPDLMRRSAVRLVLVSGCMLYVMASCASLCVYPLVAFLDGSNTHSHAQTLRALAKATVPVIAMWASLAVLHPIMMFYAQRYQMILRRTLLALSTEQLGAGSEQIYDLETHTRTQYLIQLSNTLYTPFHGEVPLGEWETNSFTPPPNRSHSPNPSPHSAPENESGMCIICFTNAAEAVFMDCGHGGQCLECARVVARRHPNACPVCRGPIRAVVHAHSTCTLEDGRVVIRSNQELLLRLRTNAEEIADLQPNSDTSNPNPNPDIHLNIEQTDDQARLFVTPRVRLWRFLSR